MLSVLADIQTGKAGDRHRGNKLGFFFFSSLLLVFSVTISMAFNTSEIQEAAIQKQQVCMGGKALK